MHLEKQKKNDAHVRHFLVCNPPHILIIPQ
jgi:hypothetical protein